MEKMTYVGALSAVLTSAMQESNPEVYEKLSALRASLERKASRTTAKTETKAQREAAEFAQTVLGVLAEQEAPVQCGALAKELGVSGQKVSAALRKLTQAGQATKTVEKGVSYFSAVEAE